MSFIGGSSGIRFSGIGSGIDTDSIITQLLALERRPMLTLANQKAILQQQKGAAEQYKSLAQSLRTALEGVSSSNSFTLAKAVSSKTDVATVAASADAQAGIYDLRVSRLAQAHKIRSNAQSAADTPLNLAGTFTINGKSVTLETSDTLQMLASKINVSGAGVTASVINGGSNNVYITLTANETGAASAISRSDTSGSVLSTLGLLTGNEILAAQDASYTIDNVSFTNSKNTITGVIPNVTISLLKANEVTPEQITITVSRDVAGIRSKVEGVATAYNAIVDYLKQTASFDSETLASGPLFGDSTILGIQASLFNSLTASPDGLAGEYKNLLAIGIDFDSSGRMTVDAAKVEEAISKDLTNVKSLFQDVGTISNANVTFVSATSRTKGSGAIGYSVNITQAATLGSTGAGVAMTGTHAGGEILTFSGALLGFSDYELTVDTGSSLDQLISKINSDAKLKDLLTASKDGSGRLVLTSKRYGTPGSFTVVSNLNAASDNSGIGTTLLGGIGLDVAGSINGEAATGVGQFLTGNAGNAKTDGLQLLITGSATGDLGTLVLTRGAGSTSLNSLSGALDFTNGSLSASIESIQAKIEGIQESIERIQERADAREIYLRRKFTAMEDAMARLQAQMAQLNSMIGSLNFNGSQSAT